MSNTGVDSSSTNSHIQSSERPLIVAAYHYRDPLRKRRVKVPPNILWKDFLGLFYSRLNIDPDSEIEVFDEKGIEIVSVEDLVENDILVVKEFPSHRHVAKYDLKHESRSRPSSAMRFSPHGQGSRATSPLSISKATGIRTPDPSDPAPTPMGVPQLSHFIQSNSFGYYFLAEVENMKLLPAHGKIKKTHCIVKVPHCEKTSSRSCE